MARVVIDAGHGGRDPGAVYNGRQEKDDTLDLALAVGEILRENGVDVVYTRTEDVYDSPTQKADIANEAGADYLVSIHRNAMPNPGTATGIETLVYADSGVRGKMARDINAELEALGFKNRGVIERPNLAVLRRSRMPAVLVEAGFIDNIQDNEKFDTQLEEIAQAIANGIMKTTGSNRPTDSSPGGTSGEMNGQTENTPATGPRLYRVQVGAYRNRNLANALSAQLSSEGIQNFITYDNGLYKVQAGAFSQMDNAVRMEQRLRRMGYSTYLTT